jgi:tRNA(His) guanylyltransferase
LKEVEGQVDMTVEAHQPFFIRLDGCTFSTFLKGVVKPFDYRITNAMVKTTADLVSKFQPNLGYTSSDEISLVFTEKEVGSSADDVNLPAEKAAIKNEPETNAVQQIEEQDVKIDSKKHILEKLNSTKSIKKPKLEVTHAYNGRLQKLASVAAGYAR